MALQVGQTVKLGSGIKTGVAPGQSQYGVGAGGSVKIIGSKNVGGQLYYDIQDLAKGGGTGWTLASGLQGAGGGGAGIPGVLPLPKAPSFTKSTQFTGEATKEVAPLYDPQIQTTKGQLPLLQKRYDLYLEQVTTAGEQRKGELETKQIADVSRTGSAAATRGLRGGLVEAQVRGVETTYEKLINTLTTDITSQKKELGISRESKELELRGMIASLVGQKASKIMELSRILSNTSNEQQMQAFTNLFNLSVESFDRSSELFRRSMDKQELDISRQRLAQETMSQKKESALDDFASVLGSTKNFQRDMAVINSYLKKNPQYKSAYRTIAYSLGKGKEFDDASKPPKKDKETKSTRPKGS